MKTRPQVRFMLETMMALKNNDMRKIPGYDPEPVERLRKLQRSLVGESHILFDFITCIIKNKSKPELNPIKHNNHSFSLHLYHQVAPECHFYRLKLLL